MDLGTQTTWSDFSALMPGMCCAYLPDLEAQPLPCRIPVDFETGGWIWPRILCDADPVRRLDDPVQANNLRTQLLFVDVGRFDEYNSNGRPKVRKETQGHGH